MSKFEVTQHNLNSSIPLVACDVNPSNINPMSIATIKTDYWIANNGSTTISHYNKKGVFLNDVITTAPPTALVAANHSFIGYTLFVVTNAGTLEGYQPSINLTNTVIIPGTSVGAVYTGIAIHKNNLFLTNFASGFVEIYDQTYTLIGSFTDPNLTAIGYAPYNVTVYGNRIYVAFAKVDGLDATVGLGLGFVDKFKLDGSHMKRLINNDPLNAPYGLLVSPCGKYLYVGNHGDGKINIFDREDGCFISVLKDCYHNDFQLGGLWALHYQCNDIAVVAGINEENSGLLAILKNCEKSC
jgi:uncharacterized protein (TIGR03118 family)